MKRLSTSGSSTNIRAQGCSAAGKVPGTPAGAGLGSSGGGSQLTGVFLLREENQLLWALGFWLWGVGIRGKGGQCRDLTWGLWTGLGCSEEPQNPRGNAVGLATLLGGNGPILPGPRLGPWKFTSPAW